MSRGRGRRDNDLIGQTVRISQGPYKGAVSYLAVRTRVRRPQAFQIKRSPFRGSSVGFLWASCVLYCHLAIRPSSNHTPSNQPCGLWKTTLRPLFSLQHRCAPGFHPQLTGICLGPRFGFPAICSPFLVPGPMS